MSAPEARGRRASGAQAGTPLRKKRLTTDQASVRAQLQKIAALRGFGALSRDQSLQILHVYFALVLETLEENAKSGRKRPSNAYERTARLLGHSTNTVGKVVKEYTDSIAAAAASTATSAAATANAAVTDESAAAASSSSAEPAAPAVASDGVRAVRPAGNRKHKHARIPHAHSVYVKVRDYVRERRLQKSRVTATQVLEFLIGDGIVEVKRDVSGIFEKADYWAALVATQRYLLRRGFRRGVRTGKLQIAPAHLALRNVYLREIKKNRALPPDQQLCEVYLDESYIHQHYHRLEDSVYDPNDEQDIQVRLQHKGRRYCIVAAIQGPSPTDQASEGGIVPGSVWTFVPDAQKGKRVHDGDYHKNFNGNNFAKWFKEQVLPGLKEASLIVMDNAAYHKTKPPGTPNPNKMKKAEVQAKLAEFGVQVDAGMSAVELKLLLRDYVAANIKSEVEQAAEALGHRIIFTPPHYSDLQPIELVWAYVKGNVGRQYKDGTTLADVKQRLDAQFAFLQTPEGCQKVTQIIRSVDKHIERFWKDIEIDDMDADEDEELEEIEDDEDMMEEADDDAAGA